MHNKIYKFNEDKKGFGNKLKDLMKQNGYTIESLADAVEYYGEDTIKKWRSGERMPDLDTLNKLACLFEVTMHELYLPNSIYESKISNDLCLVLDNKLELSSCSKIIIDEFEAYTNYLFQKMLYSFLTTKDKKELSSAFNNYTITPYGMDKLNLKKDVSFDEFYSRIKQYVNEQYGISHPYKINDEMSKKLLDEFIKIIELNLKKGE